MSLMQSKVLPALLVAILLSLSQKARADDYGSFVVKAPNNGTVKYQVKWGNGEWKSYTLYAGDIGYHAYPLDALGCAPSPRIRFDGVGNGNLLYGVDVYAVENPWRGKQYVFQYSNRGTCLDLYRK